VSFSPCLFGLPGVNQESTKSPLGTGAVARVVLMLAFPFLIGMATARALPHAAVQHPTAGLAGHCRQPLIRSRHFGSLRAGSRAGWWESRHTSGAAAAFGLDWTAHSNRTTRNSSYPTFVAY
jgi:hypothetical protein